MDLNSNLDIRICTSVWSTAPPCSSRAIQIYTLLSNFRNYGIGDTTIKTAIKPVRNKKSEFTLNVNNREVVVTCKNKKDGKHLAAQKLLQQVGIKRVHD